MSALQLNATSYVTRLDAAGLAAPPAREDRPVAINDDSQLFVDDYLIARRQNLLRQLNRPVKRAGTILTADREWEGRSAVYGCLVEDDEGCRLYYQSGRRLLLARSDDGVHFRKDVLDGAVRPGTNIVIEGDFDNACVFKDLVDPDAVRRYKLLSAYGKHPKWMGGLTPATSPDGVRWTWDPEHLVPYFGDRCAAWYDPIRRKYVAWCRELRLGGIKEDYTRGEEIDVDKIAYMWNHYIRKVFHSECDDFRSWSRPWLVVEPDKLDHPRTQIYSAYPFWYKSIYLAYVEVYYIHHERLDTQLMCSRDGRFWERVCEHDVFLGNGAPEAFDGYWTVPTYNPPVRRDGRLLIHYNGRPSPHSHSAVVGGPTAAFGLAELREDGFVSLDAFGEEGFVETKALQSPASARRLEINAAPAVRATAAERMRVQVEILSTAGGMLDAYLIEPPNDDVHLWHIIELSGPLPVSVRLRLRLRNAKLYAFRFRA